MTTKKASRRLTIELLHALWCDKMKLDWRDVDPRGTMLRYNVSFVLSICTKYRLHCRQKTALAPFWQLLLDHSDLFHIQQNLERSGIQVI